MHQRNVTGRTLFRGGWVVSMVPGAEPFRGDVLVEGDRIAAVSATIDVSDPDDLEVVDAGERIVLPGLVDSHRHLWQSALRGIACDWTLGEWGFPKHECLDRGWNESVNSIVSSARSPPLNPPVHGGKQDASVGRPCFRHSCFGPSFDIRTSCLISSSTLSGRLVGGTWPRLRWAMSSATMLIAISGTVCEPMS